ncbi:unnamed protein product [Camellia sinensis]
MATASWSSSTLVQSQISGFGGGLRQSRSHPNSLTFTSSSLLDAMANTGMVELGEVHLATYLFEKTFTGQPSFQNGLRSLIAFPSGCNTANCLIKYEGELHVDAVTNWFATISLSRILYQKDSLVKVIFFSETGECAAPFVRQANLLALCCFGICAMSKGCGQWQLTLRNAVNRAKGQREAKTPALVPEDADPIWIRNGIHNRLGDPRIHPVLLLGALMSFGSIWLKKDDEDRPNRRCKKRAVSNQDSPPSITDREPKDAYQMPLSDFDYE